MSEEGASRFTKIEIYKNTAHTALGFYNAAARKQGNAAL